MLRAYARPSSSTYTALGQCHWVLFLLLKKKKIKKSKKREYLKTKRTGRLEQRKGPEVPSYTW